MSLFEVINQFADPNENPELNALNVTEVFHFYEIRHNYNKSPFYTISSWYLTGQIEFMHKSIADLSYKGRQFEGLCASPEDILYEAVAFT